MAPRRSANRTGLSSLAVGATLALVIAGAPRAASAQTSQDLARAREEFGEGLALQTAGDCAGALQKFQDVARVKMTPHVQFNIALCEERLGHLVAALGHYELALSDAEAAHVDEVANPARQNSQSLEPRIPRLVIRRGAGAEGAIIELDGSQVGDAVVGSEIRRDPGSHVVTARFGDRKVFEEAFELPEGSKHEVIVTATREQTPLPGATPTAQTRTAAGAPSETRRTLGYVAGGVGLASLVTAGVFVALRQSAISDLEAECDGHACPPDAQATIDRGRLYTGIAEGGVLVGVGGIVAAAVLLFGGSQSSNEASDRASIDVSVGTPRALTGAQVLGRFF